MKLMSTVSALMLLGACAHPLVEADPEAVQALGKEVVEAKTKIAVQTEDAIPDWYLNLPEADNAVFSAGTAIEQDLQLAKELAELAAKRTLADRINGKLSSNTKEFTTRVGQAASGTVLSEVERVTENEILDVDVSGYSVHKVLVVPTGNMYRAFVVLKYPTVGNDVTAAKRRKLAAKTSLIRAKNAFRELQAKRTEQRNVEKRELEELSDPLTKRPEKKKE